MVIKIGVEKYGKGNYRPYFWIQNQGFGLNHFETKRRAKWALKRLKSTLIKLNPDVTFLMIKGTKFFSGLTKEEEAEYSKQLENYDKEMKKYNKQMKKFNDNKQHNL